ncbi:cell envelope integrity protein TolA [Agaribacterium haliotis]|uniref:cell envelope integrity protein TolA n=1 Tax=Agaribacterium haliotis TaxID=2013869 RepID=UPI001177D9E9|nr:cell envelope integrity protein TolA [Agaribacterium haliotis]
MPRDLSPPRSVFSSGAFVLSLVAHLLLGGVFLFVWKGEQEAKRITPPPRYIEAKLVKLKPETKKIQKKAQPKKVDLTKKKKPAPPKKAPVVEKKAPKKTPDQDKLKQQELEKKKREQQKQEQERQRMLELEQALKDEQLAVAEQEQELEAQSYIAAISQRIEQNWSRPPSARNGMRCELLITLVPTGRVVNVAVVETSGNAAFDRSAEQAVQKAEEFPEIKTMSAQVFEKYYRQLRLVFNPQDLRQ